MVMYSLVFLMSISPSYLSFTDEDGFRMGISLKNSQ